MRAYQPGIHSKVGPRDMKKGSGDSWGDGAKPLVVVPGIVVADRRPDRTSGGVRPKITAFIWGGKVRPTPTLPFGRWKGAA
jgi:hypothetical protein